MARSMRADVVLNACDPRFNPPIFEGAFAAGCNYVDMAMNLSVPHATKPYEKTGIRLGDGQFAESPTWKATRPDGAVRHGRRAGLLRRGRALRRRRTVQRDPRDRGARRRRPGGRRIRLRPDVLDLDDDRGVPEPTGDLRARTWLVHDRAVLGARDVHVPGGHRDVAVRQRRTRRGHPDAPLDRHAASDVQVRPRRRVHRRAQDPAQARPATPPRRSTSRASRCRRATWSPRPCPTRRRSAT